MRSVHVAELKNRLSQYLSAVRAGEEILVRNRQTPIAKIVPLPAADTADTEESALVAAGKLRLGAGPLPGSFWRMRAPRVPIERILAAVDAERHEG